MTKEITKAYILQQLEDRFKLREYQKEDFLFSETVIPVYNIESHLFKWAVAFVEAAITTTGGKHFFIVPDTERWVLNGYNVIFMGAGAYTVAGIYITRADSGTDLFYYLDLAAGQSVSYIHHLSREVVLNPGDRLSANIDGFTTTQNLRLYIDYRIEELR